MKIVAEHLYKSYHSVPVLKDVSFEAGIGVTCIMGSSGAGKTTLLRILLGLETADSGTVKLPERCRWAAVFQENRLLEHLDAMGNLCFVLGRDFDKKQAKHLLAELGLHDVDGKTVQTYSGGMKRRLALARALLFPSDALILDEPFAGLDEENHAGATACIALCATEKPVLLVTHNPSDAPRLDARVLRL